MSTADRVELTDAEREALLFGFGIRFYENADHTRFSQGVAAVESIVAARLQALTAERDTLRIDLRTCERLSREAADRLTAELTAANARCAELEAELVAEKEQLRHEVAGLRDERDALQATLDRVTALADEWDRTQIIGNNTYADELRAALTPEGKP